MKSRAVASHSALRALLKEYLIGGRALEIGPGYLPLLSPVGDSSHFIDVNRHAAQRLGRAGGEALVGSAQNLPYPPETFDLVCAFDVLEHTKEDREAFAEINRVLKGGGTFIFSVPLFEEYWSPFDELAGHKRRYQPADLQRVLKEAGFEVEKFLCPRNLLTSLFESKIVRPLVVSLRIFLALAERTAPVLVPALYLLLARSPLDQFRGVGRVPWEDGHLLGEIKKHHVLIAVCRKS